MNSDKSSATKRNLFDHIAQAATRATGSSGGFGIALAVVLIWAATGPVFQFSETWQLFINTGTTIVTFLMVFSIQHSQNKDSIAVHLKLNELVASHKLASNRLVAVEDLDQDALDQLHEFYRGLAKLAKQDDDLQQTHSIEEAEALHARKQEVKALTLA